MVAIFPDDAGNIDDLFLADVHIEIAILEDDVSQMLCILAEMENVLPLDGTFAQSDVLQLRRGSGDPRQIRNVTAHRIRTDGQLCCIRKRDARVVAFRLIEVVVVQRTMQMNRLDAFDSFPQIVQPFRFEEIHFDGNFRLERFHVQRQGRPID